MDPQDKIRNDIICPRSRDIIKYKYQAHETLADSNPVIITFEMCI